MDGLFLVGILVLGGLMVAMVKGCARLGGGK